MEKEKAATELKELVRVMVTSLVDEKGSVQVSVDLRTAEVVTLVLSVAPGDVGKVIGRDGKTARAMRTILRASSMTCQVPSHLHIVESDREF